MSPSRLGADGSSGSHEAPSSSSDGAILTSGLPTPAGLGLLIDRPPEPKSPILTGWHPKDEAADARLEQSLLWVAAFRVVLVTAGLGLAFWQVQRTNYRSGDVATWQYMVIAIAYGLGLLGIFAIRQGKNLRLVAQGQVVADAVIVTAVVLMTGGTDSVFTFTYVFVVLEGSLVLFVSGAVVSIACSTLLFGTVLVLQINQVLPEILVSVQGTAAIFSFFVHTMGLTMVGLLASNLSTKLRVTGRRLAEKEEDLERLGELHAAILRALPAGLMTIGPQGDVRFGNASAGAILRRRPSDLVGQKLGVLLPDVARALTEETLSTSPRRGRRRQCTVPVGEGLEIRLGYSFAPLALPEGSSTVVIFQDVTEVVRLEEAVERAQRLAAVGKFAAGLAHEVRNPLASMCASIDVLQQTLSPPERMQRLMRNVVREAERLDALIQDFLALARPRNLSFERVDVVALVKSVLDVFENEVLNVTLRRDLEEEVWANVDPDLIRQVIWNLLRNAADAMATSHNAQGGNVLLIRVRSDRTTASVEVLDSGPGLAPDQARRVFEPFYSTKTEGSGLGLAISQSIIQAHGGGLELFNRPEGGACARVLLPNTQPEMQVSIGDRTPIEHLEFDVLQGGR